jgi:hypothetical protein
LHELLDRYSTVWDIVFLVDKKQTILNKDLPFVQALFKTGTPDRNPNSKLMIWNDIPFLMLLAAITRTIPIPPAVDVMPTLFSIASLVWNQPEKVD